MNTVYQKPSNLSFTAAPSAIQCRELAKQAKSIMKSKNITKNECDEFVQKFQEINNLAESEISEKIKKGGIEKKLDSGLETVFTKFLGWFGRSKNAIKKSENGNYNLTNAVTTAVLWGNLGKELFGTALYTVQAMTNEDLPKEKRKFVGMYDLFVGLVSSTISLILGPGVQSAIRNGYEKRLSPLKGFAKTATIVTGASALTSFALQTILGKRILAPAIATPLAGKVKSRMEKKESSNNPNSQPKVADDKNVSQPLTFNKNGFVDLKTYVKQVNEKKATLNQ